MSAHRLEVRGLTKRYGDFHAVRDAQILAPAGSFVSLLGPSGSGKTTILMAVAGFVEPTAGDILVDDRVITAEPPERRRFGMVFQGYALFPHLTVAENIAYPLRMRGETRARQREAVERMLDLVQLRGLGGRRPRALSGGQQQRVALARALVFEPRLLLLDEPLSALDKRLRADLQWELKALHERIGTTFLYVTHDQQEAMSMSDQVVIMNAGHVVQAGAPRALYERPATRFVADFLGTSNFIEGIAEADGDGRVAIRVGGSIVRARGQIATGAPALLALRPAKVALSASAPDAPNAFLCEAVSRRYLGDDIELRLRHPDLGDVQVVTKAPDMPEGASLWISWAEDAAVPVTPD